MKEEIRTQARGVDITTTKETVEHGRKEARVEL